MKPAKSILDPAFRYRPSHATDIRKTFERIRQELEQARSNRAAAESSERVVQLKKANDESNKWIRGVVASLFVEKSRRGPA
jgi:hypothetical protein